MRVTHPIRPAACRAALTVVASFVVLCGALSGSVAVAQDGSRNDAAAHPVIAGTIELAEGDVLLAARAGGSRLARLGEPVYEGDTITTFDKAELHLHMTDGARFAVRENSRLTITSYIANGDENDRSLIDLARGAFRAVTGWIGQFSLKAKTAAGRDAYQVRTPLVTIGVRGTDHEPTHLLTGDPRGEAGSYDRVYSGKAVIQSPQGAIEVPPNRAAFHSASGPRARPRMLASVPGFFVARRHEQQFVERSREGLRNLAQRRAARREAIRLERRDLRSAPSIAPRAPQFGAPPRQETSPASREPNSLPSSPRPERATNLSGRTTPATPAGGLQLPTEPRPSVAPPAAAAPQPAVSSSPPATADRKRIDNPTPAPGRPQNPGKQLQPLVPYPAQEDASRRKFVPDRPVSAPAERLAPARSSPGESGQRASPVSTPRPATRQKPSAQQQGAAPNGTASPKRSGRAQTGPRRRRRDSGH